MVPLILRELEQEPDHWFWALQAITGESSISLEPAQQENLEEMAADWL